MYYIQEMFSLYAAISLHDLRKPVHASSISIRGKFTDIYYSGSFPPINVVAKFLPPLCSSPTCTKVLLNYTKVYEPLKDPTAVYKKKVIDCFQQLEKSEAIDRTRYHKLYPGESIPTFYGLPKSINKIILSDLL